MKSFLNNYKKSHQPWIKPSFLFQYHPLSTTKPTNPLHPTAIAFSYTKVRRKFALDLLLCLCMLAGGWFWCLVPSIVCRMAGPNHCGGALGVRAPISFLKRSVWVPYIYIFTFRLFSHCILKQYCYVMWCVFEYKAIRNLLYFFW